MKQLTYTMSLVSHQDFLFWRTETWMRITPHLTFETLDGKTQALQSFKNMSSVIGGV